MRAALELEGVSVELGQTTLQIASPAEDVGLCDSILLFRYAFSPVPPGARPQNTTSLLLCNSDQKAGVKAQSLAFMNIY